MSVLVETVLGATAVGAIVSTLVLLVRAGDQRRRNADLERQLSTLRIRLQRAQRLELVGQMAAGVAHDFGNGQQIVLAWLHTLDAERHDRDISDRAIDGIRSACEHQSELCRQLLGIAGFEEPGSVSPVDLVRVVQLMAPSLRALLDDDIDLDIEVPEQPMVVSAPRTQLEQVMLNLTINALDAIGVGGRIAVRLTTEGPDAVLEVSDTGRGIESGTIDRIFDPFFTTKAASGGSGLGLSASKEIVEALGGSITVDSAPGIGTTMGVRLPLLAGDEADTIDLRRPGPGSEIDGVVMVIDHDDRVRGAVATMLVAMGARVIDRGRIEDALVDLGGSARIDAVVTADVMPGMPLARFLTMASALRPELPVAVLTTRRDHDLAARHIDTDAIQLIRKPIDQATFSRAMATLLSGTTDGSIRSDTAQG